MGHFAIRADGVPASKLSKKNGKQGEEGRGTQIFENE